MYGSKFCEWARVFLTVLIVTAAVAPKAHAYDVAHTQPLSTYPVEPAVCGSAGKSLIGIKHAPDDFNFFYTGLTKGRVAKWQYGSSAPVWSAQLGSNGSSSLSDLSPSPDGAMLSILSYPETIILLNSATGSVLPRQFSNPAQNPQAIHTAISWSVFQNVIATGDSKGGIQLWQPDTQQPIATYSNGSESIRDLAFTKSGQFLVAVTKSDVVLWNVDNGSIPFSLKAELDLPELYINDAQLPEFNENFMTVTTLSESIVIDLSAQRVHVRYPTPIATQHATGPFNANQGPLLSMLSPDLTKIVRIYRNPMFDKVDTESGVLQTLYLDPANAATMGQVPATVAGAIKPDDDKTVLIGIKRVDFGPGCITTTVDVVQYGL